MWSGVKTLGQFKSTILTILAFEFGVGSNDSEREDLRFSVDEGDLIGLVAYGYQTNQERT